MAEDTKEASLWKRDISSMESLGCSVIWRWRKLRRNNPMKNTADLFEVLQEE